MSTNHLLTVFSIICDGVSSNLVLTNTMLVLVISEDFLKVKKLLLQVYKFIVQIILKAR